MAASVTTLISCSSSKASDDIYSACDLVASPEKKIKNGEMFSVCEAIQLSQFDIKEKEMLCSLSDQLQSEIRI